MRSPQLDCNASHKNFRKRMHGQSSEPSSTAPSCSLRPQAAEQPKQRSVFPCCQRLPLGQLCPCPLGQVHGTPLPHEAEWVCKFKTGRWASWGNSGDWWMRLHTFWSRARTHSRSHTNTRAHTRAVSSPCPPPPPLPHHLSSSSPLEQAGSEE